MNQIMENALSCNIKKNP